MFLPLTTLQALGGSSVAGTLFPPSLWSVNLTVAVTEVPKMLLPGHVQPMDGSVWRGVGNAEVPTVYLRVFSCKNYGISGPVSCRIKFPGPWCPSLFGELRTVDMHNARCDLGARRNLSSVTLSASSEHVLRGTGLIRGQPGLYPCHGGMAAKIISFILF